MSLRLRLLSLLALLSSLAVFGQSNGSYIVVDKPSLKLYVIAGRDTLLTAPVCVGKNLGNKQRSGDMRTPEGSFTISQIQDASYWTHDFGDGAGARKGAYGPWFFRLKMPKWTSIGIHGTCFPERIGTRDSEGCIRLSNKDLNRLKPHIYEGMKVIVTPDKRP